MAILTLDDKVGTRRGRNGHQPGRGRRLRLRQRIGMNVGSVLISILAAFVCIVGAADARAQAPSASEYQVKAAVLFNFAKFVEWPPEAFAHNNTPIIIGILGKDPFGSLLDQTVQGKTVKGRELMVKRLKIGEDLKACHILFVSPSEKKHLAQVLEPLKGSSVLTVSEIEQFAQQGGIINFFMQENKVHFEINVDTAEKARLKVSSKLLTLAKVVRDEHHSGRY